MTKVTKLTKVVMVVILTMVTMVTMVTNLGLGPADHAGGTPPARARAHWGLPGHAQAGLGDACRVHLRPVRVVGF